MTRKDLIRLIIQYIVIASSIYLIMAAWSYIAPFKPVQVFVCIEDWQGRHECTELIKQLKEKPSE